MAFRAILTTLFWLTFYGVFGQNGERECGSIHYSLIYKPIEIKSLDQLPSRIQDSVKNHLRNLLGQNFYALLCFKEGLFINYNDLVEADSNVKNYQWQVPTYDLAFYFTSKKSGINFYCSRITLDSMGNILNEIDFPKAQLDSLSIKFIDKNIILKTAKRAGFKTENYQIEFNTNQIVLRFIRIKKFKYIEYLDISVHTGKIVQQFKNGGIIDWN